MPRRIFPVVILKEIVWIEVYVGVISFETSVAVECVVHGKSHADGLLIGDGTGDIGFGTHDIFFDIALNMRSCRGAGRPTNWFRHGIGEAYRRRGTYPEMYITRNEFLLLLTKSGQKLKLLY